jgi:hypothetical protein
MLRVLEANLKRDVSMIFNMDPHVVIRAGGFTCRSSVAFN